MSQQVNKAVVEEVQLWSLLKHRETVSRATSLAEEVNAWRNMEKQYFSGLYAFRNFLLEIFWWQFITVTIVLLYISHAILSNSTQLRPAIIGEEK